MVVRRRHVTGPARRPEPATVATGVVVLLCVVAGVVLRYRYYRFVEPGPDADEAEMGLLARELLRGEWPVLMRNQPYGGTPWLWFLAPSVRILGLNPWGLRVPINVLGLVNAGLVIAIGRSLDWSRRRSILAGAAVWCYPLPAVYFASRETLYFIPAITAGLVALLLAVRSERARGAGEAPASTARTRRLLAGCGLALGIGFWVNPGVTYLALPVLLWLGARSLRAAREVTSGWPARVWSAARPFVVMGLAALVGALPWWYQTLLGDPRRDNYQGRPAVGLIDRLEAFFKGQLPGWSGFRVPYGGDLSGEWLGGLAWQVGFVALFVLLAFQVARPKHVRDESVLSVGLLMVPVVFLLVTAQSGPLYTNLRYVTFASPLLALVVASKWRHDLRAALAVAVLPVVAVAGSLAWKPAPYISLDPVVEELAERGTECVYGDYWAGGHRLIFESDERVIAVPTYENRNPKYPDLAEDLGTCAWLFRDGQQAGEAFEGWLVGQGIAFEEVRPGPGFVLYVPDRPVGPGDVPPAALAGN
jgi:hypothetical protein